VDLGVPGSSPGGGTKPHKDLALAPHSSTKGGCGRGNVPGNRCPALGDYPAFAPVSKCDQRAFRNLAEAADTMFIVKGTSNAGSSSFACGTADQALEKVRELVGRGFQSITVTDPKGRCRTGDEFQRGFDDDRR
jgi:hypothetical protein